jgi:hypothetical protein
MEDVFLKRSDHREWPAVVAHTIVDGEVFVPHDQAQEEFRDRLHIFLSAWLLLMWLFQFCKKWLF